MTLPNPKELKALLKVLRSEGVTQYASVDLTLTLSENSQATNHNRSPRTEEIADDDELSPEEEAERLLFLSAHQPYPLPDEPT